MLYFYESIVHKPGYHSIRIHSNKGIDPLSNDAAMQMFIFQKEICIENEEPFPVPKRNTAGALSPQRYSLSLCSSAKAGPASAVGPFLFFSLDLLRLGPLAVDLLIFARIRVVDLGEGTYLEGVLLAGFQFLNGLRHSLCTVYSDLLSFRAFRFVVDLISAHVGYSRPLNNRFFAFLCLNGLQFCFLSFGVLGFIVEFVCRDFLL